MCPSYYPAAWPHINPTSHSLAWPDPFLHFHYCATLLGMSYAIAKAKARVWPREPKLVTVGLPMNDSEMFSLAAKQE